MIAVEAVLVPVENFEGQVVAIHFWGALDLGHVWGSLGLRHVALDVKKRVGVGECGHCVLCEGMYVCTSAINTYMQKWREYKPL